MGLMAYVMKVKLKTTSVMVTELKFGQMEDTSREISNMTSVMVAAMKFGLLVNTSSGSIKTT